MSEALVGMPAAPGIVVGPVHLLRWEVPEVRHRILADEAIPAEVERLHAEIARAKDRLRRVRQRVEASAGPEEAKIFDVQLSMLEDPVLIAEVEEYIRQNLGAEKAFDLVLLEWRQHFTRHPQPMVRERVGDLIDVHIRVLTLLLGLPDHDPIDVPHGANAILVTHDLTPSLTVQLDRSAIAGIATDAGTSTSHVAILARSLGLPAVVGLRIAHTMLRGGERAILDGSRGRLVINPTDEDIARYASRALREAERDVELRAGADLEPVTLDGVRITIRSNVDIPDEADAAACCGSEGVGLMRTEFLVVGRAAMPDEDEQYRAYRRVVDAFAGRPVVIRTFDLGGDKLPVGGYPHEPNPFLGWRAIRMCLDEADIFKTQLRALLRAAVHGDVRIMLPLVVTVDEVRQARALVEEAARELETRGVPFGRSVPLGVMVETPAAAVAADTLVRDAEFFSVGTNDLVQYTLAVDRGNANLAARFTPLHPAVLRLIQRTVDVGTAHGIEVGVCGEMASQPMMVFALLGLGVRVLSVNPRSVPKVKRLLRAVHVTDARAAATEMAAASSAASAEALLLERLRAFVGDSTLLGDGLPDLE